MSCDMRERKASAAELNSVLLNFNLINALQLIINQIEVQTVLGFRIA